MALSASAGCWGRGHGGDFDHFDQSIPVLADAGVSASPDGGDTLGSGRAAPAATDPLHVRANASVTVPFGEVGFVVTANGRGGYRVTWVDTAGAGRRYHGSIYDDGSFTQILHEGMQYAVADAGRLDFESAPGAGQSGYVDFVSSVDPIVVDVLDGESDGTIYYVDGNGVTRSVPTPATFTSP